MSTVQMVEASALWFSGWETLANPFMPSWLQLLYQQKQQNPEASPEHLLELKAVSFPPDFRPSI